MPTVIWKKLGLKSTEEFKAKLVFLYWDNNLSQKAISNKLDCHVTVIENWFKRLDIPVRSRKEIIRNTKTKHIDVSETEKQILDGLMISDLHIEQGVFQSRVTFGFKHLEFANSIVDYLPSLKWNKITFNKISLGWHAKTKYSIELHKQRLRWYKHDVKIIPEDIVISPTMMLWWYLGDGYIAKYGAALCTDSFQKEENIKLVELINQENIPCHLTPKNRIRIEGNNGVQKLLSYIGCSPVVCYQYKWGEYCEEVMPL